MMRILKYISGFFILKNLRMKRKLMKDQQVTREIDDASINAGDLYLSSIGSASNDII